MKKSVREERAFKNASPWIHALKDVRRPRDMLQRDDQTEIAILGGGIAGVSTAYFILKDTKKKVILLEANKIAHGATGHNAGQVVSYFEKPFAEIVKEYGLTKAAQGQEEVLTGWKLIEEMYADAKVKAQFSRFIGYAGCTTYEQVRTHLEDQRLQKKARLKVEEVFISEKSPFLKKIPKQYKNLYIVVPHETIIHKLETKDTTYWATLAGGKGCINSALFCEEVISFLLTKYKDRFKIYEFTPVRRIELKDNVVLHTEQGRSVIAQKVVLCTNGFENIHIEDSKKTIDKSYHDFVFGIVGYMAAYLEKQRLPPAGISYFSKEVKNNQDPYFYLTRREFNSKEDLISIGGPEVRLKDQKEYIRDKPYFEKRQKEIDTFIKKTYVHAPKTIAYKFNWHGLMGYTKTGIRAIGPHPDNEKLLYNLGCNGTGILTSIYGGYKIARFLTNIRMPPSIFDVKKGSKK